jgi:glyoxylase I family protein
VATQNGTNTLLGGGGFHHVAVRVHDFDAALRFYKEALGFTERVTWGEGDKRAVMLDTGNGSYLEVFAGGQAQPPERGSLLHYAVRTDDVDGAIERAKKFGMQVTVEPKDVTIPSKPFPLPVRLAFCKGPGGEEIEFFKNELT